MPFLAFVHGRLALALILFAILLGILGFYQFLRFKAVSGGFRSGYLLLCGLTAVQALVGLLQLLGRGHLMSDPLHLVYGIFAVFFLPGVYFYVNRGDRAREALFLGIACWVVLIAYLRGVATG